MPFQKGNTLQVDLGLSVREENKQKPLRLLFEYLGSDGSIGYQELLRRLLNSEAITDEQAQFMNRWERNLEYLAPKLARKEITGADGKSLTLIDLFGVSQEERAVTALTNQESSKVIDIGTVDDKAIPDNEHTQAEKE